MRFPQKSLMVAALSLTLGLSAVAEAKRDHNRGQNQANAGVSSTLGLGSTGMTAGGQFSTGTTLGTGASAAGQGSAASTLGLGSTGMTAGGGNCPPNTPNCQGFAAGTSFGTGASVAGQGTASSSIGLGSTGLSAWGGQFSTGTTLGTGASQAGQ